MRNSNQTPRLAQDLMTSDLITLRDSDTVDQARDLMLTMGIHGIPITGADITDSGSDTVAGIVTSHDLVDEWSGEEPLRNVMSESVVTIHGAATLSEVAQTMKSELIHHLLVTEGRKPVGIISTYDLLDALIASQGPVATASP